MKGVAHVSRNHAGLLAIVAKGDAVDRRIYFFDSKLCVVYLKDVLNIHRPRIVFPTHLGGITGFDLVDFHLHPLQLLFNGLYAPFCVGESGPPDFAAESFDARVVDVVGLVEDDYSLAVELPADNVIDMRVEQVVVRVDDAVGGRKNAPG
ncbi:hypothetical protein EQH57_0442 [Dictyocoela roeselum]|nr:hypothetical protein EQH57_0442 [Dictyocoela roeselum]